MSTEPILKITEGVPFRGGVFSDREITLIPSGGYSILRDIRQRHPGFEKRGGCRKLHTVPDASNQTETIFQFSKGLQDEVHTYAQMSDGDVIEFANNPPAVTTGSLGTSINKSTGTVIPASWGVVADTMCYADGTDVPMIYSGNNEKVAMFVVYKGAEAIPSIPKKGEDYTDNVTDDDSTTVAILDSLSTLAYYDCIFICAYTPVDTFNFVIPALNTTASVAQMHYYNGTWTAVSAFTDTTTTGGATFAISPGTMSFTMTTDHYPHYMFGVCGYWYRLSLSSGALDSNVEISEVTCSSKWTKVQNVWDGIPIGAIEAYVFLNTDSTYSFYASTEITIGGMTSSDKLYFNSKGPSIAAYFSVNDIPNITASTAMVIKYWDGTGFNSSLSISDATTVNSKSLASDGWVTWTHPTDEQPTLFQSAEYFSYWYEVSFDKTLTEDMQISIETMPYLTMKRFGNAISLSPFKTRMAYAFTRLPGYVAISAADAVTTLNGADYKPQEIGDGRYNDVVSMRSFYNELLVWQEEKGTDGGCLTLIQGYNPDTYGKLIISNKIGTFSSKTTTVVDGVMTWWKEKGNVPVAMGFFLSHYGVMATEGTQVYCISHLPNSSIQNYFDPKEAECIRNGYENKMWLAFDSTERCLRIGLVSGSSATECNIFPVYDIEDRTWSFDNPAQPFSCMAEIAATSGNVTVLQLAGGTTDGTIYQTNYGTNDVTTAIDDQAVMEIDGSGSMMFLGGMILRKTGTCTFTVSVDGVTQAPLTI